jgi:hypothetical protein
MKRTFGKSNVFWGTALIFSALLIIFDAVGKNLGFIELPVIKIILCVLIGAWGVSELAKGRFAHIFLPLGFIFAILQRNIASWAGHLELVRNEAGEMVEEPALFVPTWVVIVAALLLQIGFSVILPKRKYSGPANPANAGSAATFKNDNDGYFENDLGSSACYVDAGRLGYYRAKNDLGKLDVYIENAEAYPGSGTIEITNDLGQTVIHVPTGWAVDNQIVASLGSVTCSVPSVGSPMIKLVGTCDLGNVNII